MVLQAMSSKLTNKFKAFCKTDMMDNFLVACIDYFGVFFEVRHRTRRSHLPARRERPRAALAH